MSRALSRGQDSRTAVSNETIVDVMPLSTGTRLGPYEILALIGAGGMGEVYRANDTRLNRTVAVKVLNPHLAGRAEWRQRFEREARAVASLNHPHICQLYDIGHQDGIDFLVMEYLEGETLSARLSTGPLAIDKLLEYAIQIADALAQAHRQGVYHRDLKPGNVMLTKAGAKLLDFGLAKLRGPEVAAKNLSTLPTEVDGLTQKGTILGTFQYMSPEQVEGRDTDGRSDVFSFGAVLYEMAAGSKAFTGRTQASLIAAILGAEPPPLSTLQPSAPPELGRLVKTCLEKDPDERWQSARDLLRELKRIAAMGPAAQPGAARDRAQRGWRARLFWPVAAVAVFALLFLALVYLRPAPAELNAVRFSISPPVKAILSGPIAVSPDGLSLAFSARLADGKTSLWVRRLDTLAARELPGSEGGAYPFWSPDSRSLGFFAEGKLKTLALSGGAPLSLCVASDPRGGAWSAAGVIVFSPNASDGLYRIPASGGVPVAVTKLDASGIEATHRWPQLLPDGRRFLYFQWSGQLENRGIYSGSVDGKDPQRQVLRTERLALYTTPHNATTAYLLFLRGRTLMRQPFDLARLELSGEPTPVGEQVWQHGSLWGLAAFSVSDHGVLAYRTGGLQTIQLAWFDREGQSLGPVGPSETISEPMLSPDEKRVVVTRSDPGSQAGAVWLLDLSRGGIFTRFTFEPSPHYSPVWSPDGSRIVFSSSRGRALDLYVKSSSGAGKEELLLTSAATKYPDDWSPDGRFILYEVADPKTNFDVWALPLSGDRKPFPVVQGQFGELLSRFSPDGRWIAYCSDESAKHEVYVQPFAGGPGAGGGAAGGKWQVSSHGGIEPNWRRDGKELFYLAPDGSLMAVEVKAGATFETTVPKALFRRPVADLGFERSYSVSRDGRRFLLPTYTEEAAAAPITVVVNWTAGTK